MRKPKGHVRPHGTGYQVIVPVGLEMLTDMAKGRQPRNEATFGQLLDAVLEVAHLGAATITTSPYRGLESAT